MKDNNFKRWMEEEEERAGPPPDFIENRISHTTNFFGFAGNIVELFFSAVFSVFAGMNGADIRDDKDNKPHPQKKSPDRTPDRGFSGPRNRP